MTGKARFLGAAVVAALVLIIDSSARADSTPQTVDLTPQFVAGGIQIDGLRAVEVGGIVVLRGETESTANALAASTFAQSLGYGRVANLIRVTDQPDDARIARTAERHLGLSRALDGCSFHIDSDRGVLTVAGRVHSELQKDVALGILRNIDGVRAVRASLQP